ncbi:hypothetical protein ACK2M2_00420 [Acinetobacter sp. TY1]|uniref:hypothetical protein n=1 Tax=Acinetobacter sp. TY1 TaxID=3387626 RepID=UPI003AF6601E
MKFIPIIVFFATSTVFASDMDTIHLSKAKNFNVNNCKVINSARIAISSKVSEFKINTDDYLLLELLGRDSIQCYSFNYYPDISPYLDFKVKKNTLYIIEMSGTASSGNWIKQRYNINIKNMSLIKK